MRPSLYQTVPSLLPAAVFIIIGSESADFRFLLTLPLAAVLVLSALNLTVLAGTTLTPEAVIGHGLPHREIKWAEVRHIEVVNRFGTRNVVVHHGKNRRTRLRVPVTDFIVRDPRFKEKAALIERWWLEHRGADWTPERYFDARHYGSRPTERPRIRPASSQAVPIVLLLVSLCYEVVAAAVLTESGHIVRPTLLGTIAAVPALLGLLTAMWQLGRHGGVTLTPDHVQVHNLRPRRLRWSDVAEVTVKRTRTGSRVIVRELTGRQTRLSSPRIGLILWDRDFADKAWAIHRQWQAGIATPVDERTADELGFHELGGSNAPRLWKRLLVTTACAVLGYELFVTALVGTLLVAFGASA